MTTTPNTTNTTPPVKTTPPQDKRTPAQIRADIIERYRQGKVAL
jgi:hypothetical protein